MNKEELNEITEAVSKALAAKKDVVEEEAKEISIDATDLADKIGDKIAAAIIESKGGNSEDQKKLKEDLFNPRNGFQAIQYPSDLTNLTKEEKILTFFKGLFNMRDDPEAMRVVKALNEGTAGDGGYLVPEELKAEVWRILPDYSVMRKLARIIPMNTDTMLLNKLTAMPEAYWTSEYASKTTSSADFDQISLTPYKLVCLLPITQELVADANIDIVQFIVELFAERIAAKEDIAFFTGSGTGQPTGLMGALGTSVNGGGAVTFDAVIDLIMTPPQSVRNSSRAAIVAHKTGIKHLRKLKDSNNQYIWSPGQPDNGMVERLYGYPLYEMNAIAHNQMVFGDFSFYIIGDRQQLTVMTTMEGGDAWRRDSIEVKSKVRVDGECIMTSAFAKMINM